LRGLTRYDRLIYIYILDREEGGSNPPQGTEQNGSVGRRRASSHSSSATFAEDFDSIRIIILMCVLGFQILYTVPCTTVINANKGLRVKKITVQLYIQLDN
jgi:hypothetical protein